MPYNQFVRLYGIRICPNFATIKGLLLPTKRGPFACQKDYICKVQAKACKNHINIILQIRLFEVFCIIL